MLSTYLPLAFALLGFIFGAIAWYRAEVAVNGAVAMGNWVRDNNKRSVTLKKMADVESSLTDLTESYETLIDSHKKMRSRIGMRNLREKRANGATEPGAVPLDEAAKAAYKQQLRVDLRTKGLLK